VLEVRVGRTACPVLVLEGGELLGHPLEVRGPVADRRPQVRGGHERRVEVGLLGEHPQRQAALAVDLAPVGLVDARGDPQQRRLAGAVGAHQAHPVPDRDRRVDPVEDHERADLAANPEQPENRHSAAPGLARGGPTGCGRPAGAFRSGPGPLVGREADRGVAAGQLGPAPAAPRGAALTGHRAQDCRRPGAVRRPESLAPRAEVRRPAADDQPPDRAAAAAARLGRPLVDHEALLHRAVAVGRGVVVDGRTAPLDGLGEDRPDRLVQARLVRGPER
jgi:hypothetical protein